MLQGLRFPSLPPFHTATIHYKLEPHRLGPGRSFILQAPLVEVVLRPGQIPRSLPCLCCCPPELPELFIRKTVAIHCRHRAPWRQPVRHHLRQEEEWSLRQPVARPELLGQHEDVRWVWRLLPEDLRYLHLSSFGEELVQVCTQDEALAVAHVRVRDRGSNAGDAHGQGLEEGPPVVAGIQFGHHQLAVARRVDVLGDGVDEVLWGLQHRGAFEDGGHHREPLVLFVVGVAHLPLPVLHAPEAPGGDQPSLVLCQVLVLALPRSVVPVERQVFWHGEPPFLQLLLRQVQSEGNAGHLHVAVLFHVLVRQEKDLQEPLHHATHHVEGGAPQAGPLLGIAKVPGAPELCLVHSVDPQVEDATVLGRASLRGVFREEGEPVIQGPVRQHPL